MTKKEAREARDYHRSCFIGQLLAYNRSPSTEQAAFDIAAKHAAIFSALTIISNTKS